jgi:fermentation-respiration switch protein FrsA (DUF1100 family)
VNVFLFDYRGYGASTGTRNDLSESATYDDAEGARAWLAARPEAAGTRLVLFGRSLGAAIALELACRRAPDALVLESAFTSLPDLAQALYPCLPVRLLLRTRYDSRAKIPTLACPLLVLHGQEDEIVPFAQGRRLFDAAPEPKTFCPIPLAGHNDVVARGGERYVDAWRTFLEGR